MNYIDAMNEFFDYLYAIGRSKETVDCYSKSLKKYYRYLCGIKNREVYISDITSDNFEKFLLDKGSNLSSSSKYSIITAFKSFLSYCFNRGLCEINIAKQVKQIKCRVKERESLTEEEFQMLVDNIDDIVIRSVVYMMFYTGCRIGEVIKLHIDDVDFRRNTICIRKPKSHKQNSRIIPINYKLRNILLEYLSIRKDEEKENFFALKRTGRISETTINTAIKEAAQKVGLNKKVTNHILRHTFASLLAEKGIDIKRIQDLLGHSNLQITNVYLHSNPKRMKEAVDLL